jgi:hypothetical protein
MIKQRPRLLFGILSMLCFFVSTNGFDTLARVLVAHQPFGAALNESGYYAIIQPIGTLMLAAPFLVAGLLSVAVLRRADLVKASLFFVVVVAILDWFYFLGYWNAQHAILERKWTAASLSIGLLPFISIPVIIIAAIAVMVIAWNHKRSVKKEDSADLISHN